MPNQEELIQKQKQETLTLQMEQQVLQPEQMAPLQHEAQLLHQPVEEPLYDEEANAALLAHIQQEIPAVHAQQVAPGTPVQEEAPPKRTYKQRRRDKRHAAEARAQCPVGDAVTYDIVTQLQELQERKTAPVLAHGKQMAESGVDNRVMMLCLCRGYKLDKKGRPASREDEENKRADDQLFDDYCSDDVERRRPHLDRLVAEMTQFSFSPHMFSAHRLRQDAAKDKEFGDRLVYLENMQNDPTNKPYFEGLPLATRQTLKSMHHIMYNPYVGALIGHCGKRGVDLNCAQYYNMMDPIEVGEADAEYWTGEFGSALTRYTQERKRLDAVAPHWERNREALLDVENLPREQVVAAGMDYALRSESGRRTLDALTGEPELQLTPAEMQAPLISGAGVLMTPGEAHREKNMHTLSLLAQATRAGDGPAQPDTYYGVRELIAPRVQRILDCDVEALRALSGKELVAQAAQLNGLSMDSAAVERLLKLAHPTQQNIGAPPPTLYEDLVGQRELSFQYKVSVLRGLAQQARGLALLAQSRAGALPPDCFTEEERQQLGDVPEAFLAEQIASGEEQVTQAREQLDEVMTQGTPAYFAFMEKMVYTAASLHVYDRKFQQVTEEFKEGTTPESRMAMQRIQAKPYYSLAHSPSELKERGLNKDTKEALFRAFGSSQKMEALYALLTPEQYRQMLLDLGAGAGMHKADPGETNGTPEEELQPAIEQNARGMKTYKQVIKAQMDMFARKYGNSLEHMRIQDVMEHYGDYARDFAEAQVLMSLQAHYPDLLDLEDPEELLLHHRLHYYCMMGGAASSMPNYLSDLMGSPMMTSDADMEAFMVPEQLDKDCGISKAFLQEHAPNLSHGADWSQKVIVPEEAQT